MLVDQKPALALTSTKWLAAVPLCLATSLLNYKPGPQSLWTNSSLIIFLIFLVFGALNHPWVTFQFFPYVLCSRSNSYHSCWKRPDCANEKMWLLPSQKELKSKLHALCQWINCFFLDNMKQILHSMTWVSLHTSLSNYIF